MWSSAQLSENWDHGIWSHNFMANNRETMEIMTGFIFLVSEISASGDCSHEIKRCLCLGRKAMITLDSVLISRDITLWTQVYPSQSYGFFSSHVWMWQLYYKEGWVPKNWCFWTVVLKKAIEGPLEIKPVNPKEN